MPMPKVSDDCVVAVMQKAVHTSGMGEFAVGWLMDFAKEQPALCAQLSTWITHCADEVSEEHLTSLTAMIGILLKSIESQIDADELMEELGE